MWPDSGDDSDATTCDGEGAPFIPTGSLLFMCKYQLVAGRFIFCWYFIVGRPDMFLSCAGLAQDERLAVQRPRCVIPVIYSVSDTHCFAEIDRVCICVLVRRPDALSGDLGAVLRRWDILFLPQLGSLVHRISDVKWARDVSALMGASPLSPSAYLLWCSFHALVIHAPLSQRWVSAGYNLVIKTPLHRRAVTWLTPASFTELLLRGIGTSDVAEWKEWSRRVHVWLVVVGAASQFDERVRGG